MGDKGKEELRGILGSKINVGCFLVLLCIAAIAAALASIVWFIAQCLTVEIAFMHKYHPTRVVG